MHDNRGMDAELLRKIYLVVAAVAVGSALLEGLVLRFVAHRA